MFRHGGFCSWQSGANLYAVKFFSENNGYILGSNATLYKYRA